MRKRFTWLALGAAALLVCAAALAAVLAAGDGGTGRAAHVALGSSGVAAETATHRTTGNFGPNVQTGTFDGVSPAVSDLPVLPVIPVTSVVAGDIDANPNKGTPPSNVQDPVVQKKHGQTG